MGDDVIYVWERRILDYGIKFVTLWKRGVGE
jgi:hypothetical protein